MTDRSLGRAAVALVVVSSVVHVVLAFHAPNVVAALALLAMAAVCLTCVPSLWRGGSVHSWLAMVGLTGSMLYAHWALCFACGPEVHHSYGRSGLSTLALLLMAVELALAATGAVRLLLDTNTNANNREVVPS